MSRMILDLVCTTGIESDAVSYEREHWQKNRFGKFGKFGQIEVNVSLGHSNGWVGSFICSTTNFFKNIIIEHLIYQALLQAFSFTGLTL